MNRLFLCFNFVFFFKYEGKTRFILYIQKKAVPLHPILLNFYDF